LGGNPFPPVHLARSVNLTAVCGRSDKRGGSARTPRPVNRDRPIAVSWLVAVRIEWPKAGLRDRAKQLGVVWRPAQKIRERLWEAVRRLGIVDRVIDDQSASDRTR